MSINGSKAPAVTTLEALCKAGISLCVETAEYLKIAKVSPTPVDATVDFPLILEAVTKPEYAHLLKDAAAYASSRASAEKSNEATLNLAMSRLLALLGRETLSVIPGRVSIPLDPCLFIDVCATETINTTAGATQTPCESQSTASLIATASGSETYSPEDLASALARARALLAENDTLDLARMRVLVQIPATPLGMAVAHALEAAGAHVAMMLVSTVPQALACAQVGASVISLAVDDSRLVQRVTSDLAGCGYTKRTEVMACGSSSLEVVTSLIPCEEAGTATGSVSMIALKPDTMNSLHITPSPSSTSTLVTYGVDDSHFSSVSTDATVASSLPEYFSRSTGRTTADYAKALTQDHLTVEKLESVLQKHSMCAQMVEELLRGELDRVVIGHKITGESGSLQDSPVEGSVVSEGDITSIGEELESLSILPEDPSSSEDEGSDVPSGPTTDFEDVELRSPLANSASASKSVDAPTKDITDTGDDRSAAGSALRDEFLASVVSGEERPALTLHDGSKSDSVALPISACEKPHMSVKARVMEIEARLQKGKQAEEMTEELTSDVSVCT